MGTMVLLVFAAYLPALNAEFGITDDRAVARNPRLPTPTACGGFGFQLRVSNTNR